MPKSASTPKAAVLRVPEPPAAVYRGDRYRLNFTAGTILVLLNDYGAKTVTEVCEVLQKHGADAGIPGGPAGLQWTPPAPKPGRTFTTAIAGDGRATKRLQLPPPPEELDPNNPPEVEYYDDLVREHCTVFERDVTRIRAVVRMLQYTRLVEVSDDKHDVVSLSDTGKQVVGLMRGAESAAQAGMGAELTAVQQYLVGDERDLVGTHTIPFTVLPFAINDAVLAAQSVRINASTSEVDGDTALDTAGPTVFENAVQRGVEHPDQAVNVLTRDYESDATLPIRRSLHRHPTYRQFLWILHNDKQTFIWASVRAEHGAEATEALLNKVGNKATYEIDPKTTDPVELSVKKFRTVARVCAKFTAQVLTGGPEGVWVGKPLNPRDVHSDVVSFIAAGRPGFDDRVSQGSSMSWETFDMMKLSMGDFENTRILLNENHKKNALLGETPALDVESALDPHDKNKRINIERTSRKALMDIGIDIESNPVLPSDTGMDTTQCQYINTHLSLGGHGATNPKRCNGAAINHTGFCEKHGGTYLSPDETQSLLRANQQKLFAATSMATEVVIDLMMNSSNDAIRLRAAEQILNRGGLSESRDINVSIDDKTAESPRTKLLGLITRLNPDAVKELQAADPETAGYGTVIDAEVEETPEPQPESR